MVKKIKIELQDYHYQCADRCCDEYGQLIYVNGKELNTTNADNSEVALKEVLTHLGYEVEIDYRYDDE